MTAISYVVPDTIQRIIAACMDRLEENLQGAITLKRRSNTQGWPENNRGKVFPSRGL